MSDVKSIIQDRIDEADRSELQLLDIDAIKAELAQELGATGQPKNVARRAAGQRRQGPHGN